MELPSCTQSDKFHVVRARRSGDAVLLGTWPITRGQLIVLTSRPTFVGTYLLPYISAFTSQDHFWQVSLGK